MALGVVTLQLPKLSAEVCRNLARLIRQYNEEDGVRAVILTGSDDTWFCDEIEIPESPDAKWFEGLRVLYAAFRAFSKPLVAALNGNAVGVGFEIALLADIRIAHDRVAVGCPGPSALALWLLGERIGLSRAIEMVLTGKMFFAGDAPASALFHRLVEPGRVQHDAAELAKQLGAKPTAAVRLNKRRFCELTEERYQQAMEAGIAALGLNRGR